MIGPNDGAPNDGLNDTPTDPIAELELLDRAVELAGVDEMRTMFDPDTHPKAHSRGDPDEPVADTQGRRVDMMGDTPAMGEQLSMFDGAFEASGSDLMSDTPALEDDTGMLDGSFEPDLGGGI